MKVAIKRVVITAIVLFLIYQASWQQINEKRAREWAEYDRIHAQQPWQVSPHFVAQQPQPRSRSDDADRYRREDAMEATRDMIRAQSNAVRGREMMHRVNESNRSAKIWSNGGKSFDD